MGHLSFLLGHFELDDNLDIHNGVNFDIPRWFAYLQSHGIPQSWLCILQASTVYDFSSRSPHVGIFLDFLEDHMCHQPHVKWYMFLNIPVWYPWTARHEKEIKQKQQLEYLWPQNTAREEESGIFKDLYKRKLIIFRKKQMVYLENITELHHNLSILLIQLILPQLHLLIPGE
jgi:hypothetical protein